MTFTKVWLVSIAAALMLSMALAVPSQAASCGSYKGVTIATHGGLSCKQAKQVYSYWQEGSKGPPKGWTCGLSARGCNKGKKGFTFHINGGY